MIDVKKAMLDPTMMFKDPKDIVANDELARDQKIEILKMENVVLRHDPTRATPQIFAGCPSLKSGTGRVRRSTVSIRRVF